MLLQLKDLVVAYGQIDALHGISLNVEQGQIVAIIGANGAGKTTLLNAISGVLPVKSRAISASLWYWGSFMPSSTCSRSPPSM